jgi:DNA polymerase III alpha subunit
MTEFAHLHVHSDFSLQDAAAPVMRLCEGAEELGMKAPALTDHGIPAGKLKGSALSQGTSTGLFPEYLEALANTLKTAGRCFSDVPRIKTKDLPGCLPDFEIPLGFPNVDGYLRRLVMEGLSKRCGGA